MLTFCRVLTNVDIYSKRPDAGVWGQKESTSQPSLNEAAKVFCCYLSGENRKILVYDLYIGMIIRISVVLLVGTRHLCSSQCCKQRLKVDLTFELLNATQHRWLRRSQRVTSNVLGELSFPSSPQIRVFRSVNRPQVFTQVTLEGRNVTS